MIPVMILAVMASIPIVYFLTQTYLKDKQMGYDHQNKLPEEEMEVLVKSLQKLKEQNDRLESKVDDLNQKVSYLERQLPEARKNP